MGGFRYSLVLLLLSAGHVTADLVTVQFSSDLAGNLTQGSLWNRNYTGPLTIAGSYTYDDALADQSGGIDQSGKYSPALTALALLVTDGSGTDSYTLADFGAISKNEIETKNDPSEDIWDLELIGNDAELFIVLRSNTNPFTSDELPSAAGSANTLDDLALANWNTGRVFRIVDKTSGSVEPTLTQHAVAAVPEPSTLGLVLVGAAALWTRRRACGRPGTETTRRNGSEG